MYRSGLMAPYFGQYIDECITRQFPIPLEGDNGPTGFGWNADWTIADGENPENLNEESVDQMWNIYLLNEDSYDKEVQINISKTWEP